MTSRADIARYVSYVLTHLPAEQLKNRDFMIAGDNKVTSHGSVVMSDCLTEEKPLNSRSTKYSRRMKKRLGRSSRSLTSPFPNSIPD